MPRATPSRYSSVFTSKGFIVKKYYPRVIPYSDIKFKTYKEAKDFVIQLQKDQAERNREYLAFSKSLSFKMPAKLFVDKYEIVDAEPDFKEGDKLSTLLGKYIIMRKAQPVVIRGKKLKSYGKTVYVGGKAFKI